MDDTQLTYIYIMAQKSSTKVLSCVLTTSTSLSAMMFKLHLNVKALVAVFASVPHVFSMAVHVCT